MLIHVILEIESGHRTTTCTYPFQVGYGNQNVKWLSLAVAQRHRKTSEHGLVRHRENLRSPPGKINPSSIGRCERTAKTPEQQSPNSKRKPRCEVHRYMLLGQEQTVAGTREISADEARQIALSCKEDLNPQARIADVLKEGDFVLVRLRADKSTDRFNNKKYSDYHCRAFGYSEGLEAYFHRNLEEKDKREKEAQVRLERKEEKYLTWITRQYRILTLEGGEELKSIFQRDWEQIRVIPSLVSGGIEGEEMEMLREVFLDHYQRLRDVFRYYSNLLGDTNSHDGTYTMNQTEFTRFMFDLGSKVKGTTPVALFLWAATGEQTTPSLSTRKVEMTRATFLEAIGIMAAHSSSSNYFQSNSSALTLTSHQLENFLEGAMAKLADQTQSTGSIRAQMNTFGVMKTVVENIDILKQVFADFADIDVESDAPEYDPDDVLDEKRHLYVDPEDMQMSMEAFVSMLSGLGLIDERSRPSSTHSTTVSPGEETGILSLREAQLAFCLAQSEDEGGAVDENQLNNVDGLDELNFREYIEALAHIALSKWEEPKVSLGAKISRLIAYYREYIFNNQPIVDRVKRSNRTFAYGENDQVPGRKESILPYSMPGPLLCRK